jgi:chemotaxis protein MotB
MSAGGFNDRRRRLDHADEHEGGDERWLLTYSDMITLLMALFIIMWAISTVNVTKFEDLKRSLSSAFNGTPLEDGQSVLEPGTSALEAEGSPMKPVVEVDPMAAVKAKLDAKEAQAQEVKDDAATKEFEELMRIKKAIEKFAATHGFKRRIKTTVDERGLVVRLLTDEVLFDPGQAVVKSQSLPLLAKISALLGDEEISNRVRVEGNTDPVPISDERFRSNWELSTSRATSVLQYLLEHGIAPKRLSAAGYADQHPVATNRTAHGRSLNRRVDLVVLRRFAPNQQGVPE